MSEEKFWLSFWGIVLGTIAIVVIAIVTQVQATNRELIKNGYHQVPTLSVCGTHWEK